MSLLSHKPTTITVSCIVNQLYGGYVSPVTSGTSRSRFKCCKSTHVPRKGAINTRAIGLPVPDT